MPFRSSDAYQHFETSVLRHMRYMHEECVQDFLLAVQETARARTEKVKAGELFWRAQLGHTYRLENKGEPHQTKVAQALSPERMKPDPELVRDGRVNPRGIAYLYLSSVPNTACAEVRPWLGAYVSVGQFETKRDLRIVNCTSNAERFWEAFDETTGEFPSWEPHEYERGRMGGHLLRSIQAGYT
jgi:hypothetical protein